MYLSDNSILLNPKAKKNNLVMCKVLQQSFIFLTRKGKHIFLNLFSSQKLILKYEKTLIFIWGKNMP